MSLTDDFKSACIILDERRTPDGEGGFRPVWVEGAKFMAAVTLDTTMEARTAQKQGVTSLYTVTTEENVVLRVRDVFKRLYDGKFFRVTSDGADRRTPERATFRMSQVYGGGMEPAVMTKAEALHQFFSGFGMAAYTTTSVPDDAILPYLTYELVTGAWEEGEAALTVNLWFYIEGEAIPNAKAQQMSEAIGMGGKILSCDKGLIWVKRGSPWCQSLSDDTDPGIKRRRINVTAEYFTQD